MQAVKSKNTGPEMVVRRMLHAEGYRYRLHRSDLPGCPDVVFPGKRKVIFIHGCFWHGHQCARGNRMPKANTEYWFTKINRNRSRHQRVRTALEAAAWKELTIWECEIKDVDSLLRRIKRFLG